MKVVDFDGVYEVSNPHDLETVLRKRYGKNINSFWLSHGTEEYPTLSVLVKGDLTAMHYLPDGNKPGFRSEGCTPGLKPDESTTFSNSNNSADDVEIVNDAIVPFATALQVAKEFFLSKDLPRSVEWLEL